MASSQLSADPRRSSSDRQEERSDRVSDAEPLLELLGDEYTQRVLRAIGDESLTGSELIERAGVSKATAYRRLDDLQEAGIVESTMRIDPDGHHCEQYQLAVDNLSVSFGPDGFEVTIDHGDSDAIDADGRLLAPADD